MRNQLFYLCTACTFAFNYSGAQEQALRTPALISPLPLTPSISVVDHPVSTSNPRAQHYFNEGLTQVFAFNHDLAFFEFEKAVKEDPNLAMAYWGMALALGQNINQEITPENEKAAYAYAQKALSLLSYASPVEKGYIQALAVRYTDDPKRDLVALRHRYCDAMKELVKRYPQDLDATCLYVESILNLNPWRYWTWDGKPKDRTMEAIEILQSVLNRDPNHLGGNHFYIHAWEESPTPERALLSAFRLTALYPYGGHLLHMPCHIFILCGYYENAVATSKQAIAVDRGYIQKYGLKGPYPLHYLTHNLKVLARANVLWGNVDGALSAAAELAQFVSPHYHNNPHLARNLVVPLEVNLYFHRWKEALDLSIPDTSDPYVKAFFHFGRAFAFIRLGNRSSYQIEREKMLELKKQLAPDDEVANNPPGRIIDLATLLLDAEEIRTDVPAYIKKLQAAVDIQDRLDYDEPPAWYLPLHIELGQALLEDKRYTEAESVFIKGLQEYQRNGLLLKGLSQSLKAQGRDWDAFWTERQASKATYNSQRGR